MEDEIYLATIHIYIKKKKASSTNWKLLITLTNDKEEQKEENQLDPLQVLTLRFISFLPNLTVSRLLQIHAPTIWSNNRINW